ncbi:threonine synthase [Commensalibacter papalotli (ex Botero et al. 2024)]|uniref:Threonine synthase n=1 Tax=Commensalibacter papalotli (ex Botero et al. 2024) TaxID=2972766 RepID=A0ABM9HJT1_9PROT|nr:threonine synthase [Commensalibacter papalotli (ex Botero et al. 2024)]CAI3923474.1 Threonine synthase (ThrC) (PDB:1VB3) [Commensalibacter papalotli (ex Botero et al. 2024)]CAI3928547.1 Threonine synthase (ThrC) (PDB:1VB3) [Commensalibacter papalotli (ex Botero et al. 2024)]
MRYVSTRGQAPVLNFSDTLLAGLAQDGGLYIPETWPQISADDLRNMRGLSYPELAAKIVHLFTGNEIPEAVLLDICKKSYAGFNHQAIVPLVQLDHNLFVQELFHGPTLAFKDMAMQLLGHLFDYVLSQKNKKITIVGATSGDTGSAAIEAFKGSKYLSVTILHPYNRTSEVQRRQMTTVMEPNINNIAVEGSFDDCQDLVKAMFADAPFRDEMHLSAVNSINWGRIAAQVPYYIYAALLLGAPDREVSFTVPTGNFGNILAAWTARKMGLPINLLCVGSNHNDILTRFLLNNDMSIQGVRPSLSPSMDIQISSNFERLLFELLDRNTDQCRQIMQDFRKNNKMDIPASIWNKASENFKGMALSDQETKEVIQQYYKKSAYLADPHTAIGIATAQKYRNPEIPMVTVATAHPAKFPDAIKQATGITPALPLALADLYERKERYEVLPADLKKIEDSVRAVAHKNNI